MVTKCEWRNALEKPTALKVRAAVILVKDEKVLLVKHRKPQGSYWVLPGGTVEQGETIGETAKKEVKEETNLKIALDEIVFISECIPRDGHRHIIDFFFRGRILEGELQVARDEVLQEARFFDLKALDELDFYPDIKEELKNGWKNGFRDGPKYLGNRWDK